MSDPAQHPGPGARIGPFRLVRRLGGGGMGVVHEAVDEALDRPVALKLLAPRLAGDAAFRRRFTDEARALAALDSPHVVRVHAHGVADGHLYLATELMPDGDLEALLTREGPLPPRAALDLVAQVAVGLAAAHAAGLVHRDVKPANVLLDRRGSRPVARLGDFGIACRDGAAAAGGGTVGTPLFMAPELHTGAGADVRSDVYALGCLLWTVLTGQPPYAGTTGEVERAHRCRPVPRLPGRSPLVRAVNGVLARAMAKDPAARYDTAAELCDDLQRAAAVPRGRAPGPRPTEAVLVAAALVVLVMVLPGWTPRDPDGPVAAGDAATPATAPPPRPRTVRPRDAAVRSVAAALRAPGSGLTRGQARCTAARWVDDVGVARLESEGFLTESLAWVDLDVAEVSRGTRVALTEATLACLRAAGQT